MICLFVDIASLGCSANGYSGAIPVFPDAEDGTDDIDIGPSGVEGQKVVATNDPCAQVDQDNDGTVDSDDTDDDGDDVLDGDDNFNSLGACENLDELDSDSDNVPDIYQSFFSDDFSALKLTGQETDNAAFDDFLEDLDNDDVPDGCDADYGCDPDEFDTDGDCLPDEFDYCSDDIDEDGFDICDDCDDGDSTTTFECYCSEDNDEDGVDICSDCDDSDPDVGADCGAITGSACEIHDCSGDATAFSGDFECQLFAENDQTDEFSDDNLTCVEGCCVITGDDSTDGGGSSSNIATETLDDLISLICDKVNTCTGFSESDCVSGMEDTTGQFDEFGLTTEADDFEDQSVSDMRSQMLDGTILLGSASVISACETAISNTSCDDVIDVNSTSDLFTVEEFIGSECGEDQGEGNGVFTFN